MKYNRKDVHPTALSRFGTLDLASGSYNLPVAAPGLRTRIDVKAIEENWQAGIAHEVLVPFTSRRETIGLPLRALLARRRGLVTAGTPALILADIEAEALSFNCVARLNYLGLGNLGTAVGLLMQSALGKTGDGRINVHTAWRQMQRQYDYVPLVRWVGDSLASVASYVFSLPTSIIRADTATVDLALDQAEAMLPLARRLNTYPKYPHTFGLFGVHLLFHGEFFDTSSAARHARLRLEQRVSQWHTRPEMRGLVVTTKVSDHNNTVLSDPTYGKVARRQYSELHANLQAAIDRSGGILATFDVGARALGLLDSGVDIVSVKASGRPGIEVPIPGKKGPRGQRPPPDLTIRRAMTDEPWTKVKQIFDRTGAYPVPDGVQPIPYWTLAWSEAQLHAARVRCGVFHEVAREYRAAGLDPRLPLSEAVRSRVIDAGNRLELADLCPSI